jgi:hypothetical protein
MTDNTPSRIEPAYAAAMPAPQGGALPTGLEWQALERMAGTLANSSLIPYRLKGKPGDVAVILLAAREYGIPPLMALSKLPVVNGTPAPMGELMVALILRAGHYIAADFRNPDGSVYKGGPVSPQHYGECRYRRAEWTDTEALTFTLDEALTAGLIDRIRDGRAIARVTKTKNGQQVEEVTPWESYTPNMARWRAVANVGRLAFADVLMGLSYLPEELGAVVDADGAPLMVDGEIVTAPQPDRRPRRAPGGTLEARQAQETADRLRDFPGPVDVLDNVLAHARDNGYLDQLVNVPGHDEPIGLEAAIAEARARIAEATPGEVADTTTPAADEPVDAVLVEDPPAEAQEAAEEPASAPQEPEQPTAAPPAQETPQDAAYDVAREALNTRDADLLRTLYRGSADLIGLDVLAVVGDDDLAALDAPQDLEALPLGTLIMRVADYVKRHGAAVRDLGEPLPAQAEGPDPWAADAAAGWPNRPLP